MSRMTAMLVCCFLGCLTAMGSARGDTAPYKIGRYPQEVAVHYGISHGLPSLDVTSLRLVDGTLWADTAAGSVRLDGNQWQSAPGEQAGTPPVDEIPASLQAVASTVRKIVTDPVARGQIAATNSGLFAEKSSDAWERIEVVDSDGLRWDMGDILVAAFDSKGLLGLA